MSHVSQSRGSLPTRRLGWVIPVGCVVVAAAGIGAMGLGADDWLQQRLPARLLRPGPWGVAAWRWLLLPLVLAVAWSLGYLLSRLTRGILTRVVRRTSTPWDEALLVRIGAPLTLAWMIFPSLLLLP